MTGRSGGTCGRRIRHSRFPALGGSNVPPFVVTRTREATETAIPSDLLPVSISLTYLGRVLGVFSDGHHFSASGEAMEVEPESSRPRGRPTALLLRNSSRQTRAVCELQRGTSGVRRSSSFVKRCWTGRATQPFRLAVRISGCGICSSRPVICLMGGTVRAPDHAVVAWMTTPAGSTGERSTTGPSRPG